MHYEKELADFYVLAFCSHIIRLLGTGNYFTCPYRKTTFPPERSGQLQNSCCIPEFRTLCIKWLPEMG